MSLREKCPYSELFWSAFYRIRTRITPNTDTFYAVNVLVNHEYTTKPTFGSQAILNFYIFNRA